MISSPTSHGSGRFIPAGAGNRGIYIANRRMNSVHPRGGGEQVLVPLPMPITSGSSPRGRGTDVAIGLSSGMGRFIPAGAGNR